VDDDDDDDDDDNNNNESIGTHRKLMIYNNSKHIRENTHADRCVQYQLRV
jgi:hypothetical protein